MKKLVPLLLLLATLGCNKQRQLTTAEQQFCGRWMITDAFGHNHERYWIKKDGTFIDELRKPAARPIAEWALKPQGWRYDGDSFVFEFSVAVPLFHIGRKVILPINRPFNLSYKVKMINDSLMVLAIGPTKHYAERAETYKRMKSNGRYIVE